MRVTKKEIELLKRFKKYTNKEEDQLFPYLTTIHSLFFFGNCRRVTKKNQLLKRFKKYTNKEDHSVILILSKRYLKCSCYLQIS